MSRRHFVVTVLSGVLWAASYGVASGAGVSGVVTFEGKPPTPRVIETRADDYCKKIHAADPLYADFAAIGADGAFEDIFVWIDNPPAGEYAAPAEPMVLDQKGCHYAMPVFGMMVGQTLQFTNSDETTHNVRGFPKNNRIFNFGQPPGLPPRSRVFENAEMPLKIKCDVHVWMKAYCFVMDHPYFAVTGADGAFEIGDVPAGTYTLKAWHERLGELKREIAVGSDGVRGADFTFRRPEK